MKRVGKCTMCQRIIYVNDKALCKRCCVKEQEDSNEI